MAVVNTIIYSSEHRCNPFQQVVTVGKYKQAQNKNHTYIQRYLHKLVARFFARYHFVDDKKYIPSVEHRYGQYIHKGKYNR